MSQFLDGDPSRLSGGRELGGGGSEFGVHVQYTDIYNAIVFLALIYTLGILGQKFLRMPSLVGQIFAGIIWGPSLLDLTPYPEAWVMFGEIGLILLVIEAGIDIDIVTLKMTGPRGIIIATLGSVFPIAIGMGVAFALGADTKASIAAGASFGPTSLGIAMNILRAGKISNTPIGQLIIAAAIIDDMIALIILSQLTGLAGTITLKGVLIPIVSALGFLVIGGIIALFYFPKFLERYVLKEDMSKSSREKLGLGIMFSLLLVLMPATHYSEASHLMGAFIAGLAFCTRHDVHVAFVHQFKRVLQWLIRIFFAATIGFQVPIKKFGDGEIIWKGLLFTLALLGKLGVGFLVPNFTQDKKFHGNHLRDCLIVGCSMAAEGEFAFVIAAYSVDSGLLDGDLYSSIVLAILLSTVIAPFSLRFTIHYFEKKTFQEIEDAEELEKVRQETGNSEEQLKLEIQGGISIFLWINTTSHADWGTLPKIMRCFSDLSLGIIDHRTWHRRHDNTVVNEAYAKVTIQSGSDNTTEQLESIEKSIHDAIDQKDAVVTVGLWLPGILDDVAVDEDEESKIQPRSIKPSTSISQKLYKEAHTNLEKNEIKDVEKNEIKDVLVQSIKPKRRTNRVRTASTPLDSGTNMFISSKGEIFQPTAPILTRKGRARNRTVSSPVDGANMFEDGNPRCLPLLPGECYVQVTCPNSGTGKNYTIKMKKTTLIKIESHQPLTLTHASEFGSNDTQFLDGLIRKGNRANTRSFIEEE